ncbi:MAG TPA: alpha-L-rhamnosidase C-terminal domain-containing protein [Terriglobia bacterium]|nr:alpha-L-rhamnosidase C-terminal domain-containing protein [Terriglobia bacterium]
MSRSFRLLQFIIFVALAASGASAQQHFLPAKLDLTGDIASPNLESATHHPLPEQYVWAPGTKDSDWGRTFYFRDTFNLKAAPHIATLYVAGPDRIRVYVNGRLMANAERDPKSRLRPMVLALPLARALHAGSNTLAMEVAGGDRLVAKIVPRAPGLMGPALAMTDGTWQSSDQGPAGWQRPGAGAASWKPVRALGGVESDIDFFQWNSDAGMYQWPGYDGISPFLAHVPVPVESVVYAFDGLGRLEDLAAIAPVAPEAEGKNGSGSSAGEFRVMLPPVGATREEYPFVVLDLGRESDGRLELTSDSAEPMKLELQFGESRQEAINEPYLGVDSVMVPPHATVRGPKSAFRYAVVRFVAGTPPLRFKSIRLDTIYYPVKYQGSFESSDPLLNRIWAVGAYTSHLSMQDDIWDAPKRDRGRWMGDLDVSGRVIDTVFADHFLMQDTLNHLIAEAGKPVHGDVNGIPGYSAFWVMGQADYYRHIGDRSYLESIRQPLAGLLDYMETELDNRPVFANTHKSWPFVDWSPDLNGDTPEARRATTLEFAEAFTEGAWLLGETGDSAGEAKYAAEAASLKQAAQQYLLDASSDTFGTRWETNAMAIFSGVANDAETRDIWDKVLSRPRHFMITPYYNFYVITAMAESGHRKEALDWIREYWGGMIHEGATSFWEAYDPDWPKGNFHESLQADNGQGYFVSLCHGWSSGPTAWLTEQVVGITPEAAGFSKVSIRPDLAGLEWARGTEPTPHGPIRVDLRSASAGLETTLDLPDGVDAEVSMPAVAGVTSIKVNGQPMSATPAEGGRRLMIHLDRGGSYMLTVQ